MIRTLLAVSVLIALASNAEARPRHRQPQVVQKHAGRSKMRRSNENAQVIVQSIGQLVSHPAGCPPVLFCGCGASIRVFGRSIRKLWLAANWFHFPRTRPAPGMVAVRRHHVFVLESDLGRGLWRVYDANSGHHLTRIHARSIAGFTIVDPHGFSLADLSL